MEEGGSVDKLWIKGEILHLHTSSVHPLHTQTALCLSVSPFFCPLWGRHSLYLYPCDREETAVSCCTSPPVPRHRKELNTPLEQFSVEGSVRDGAALYSSATGSFCETSPRLPSSLEVLL